MGTSFVRFQGAGYWTRDSDLELWLRFLSDTVGLVPEPPGWLREVQHHWHLRATVGFNGCMDAGLDDFVTDDRRKQVVIDLAYGVLDSLRARGPLLPAAELNAMELRGGVHFFADVPVSAIIRDGRAFLGLLEGRITTNAATAPPGGPTEDSLADAERGP